MRIRLLHILLFSVSLSLFGQRKDENNVIKTDTIASNKNYQLIAIPIAFYTPETDFGFGGGGQLFFLSEKNRYKNRLSNILFSGIYTLNEQIILEVTPQVYLGSGDYFIDAHYLLEVYPNLFWGIGNNTPDANEEVYNQTTHALNIAFLKRLPSNLNFGFQFTYKNHEVTEVESNGLLDTGSITGSNSAIIVGLGAVFNYDTRDNTGSPNKGYYYQAKAQFASKILGSSNQFNKFILDLREYLPVGKKSLLAFQLYSESNFGDVPFQALASYGGGNRARGYFFGRFLDKNMYVSQTEYRWRFKPRWTINAFALAGEVAEKPEDFFNIKNIKSSLGLGVRFKIFKDKDTWLRFDYGQGVQGNSGIYFGINEAF
ncbi:BamA/TamA family outer membrane protein [Winogradskyella haliclonae]|uniref:Membrane protein n=1 Tax=Winogradskyella haliclonae TaxID=2048558 RepID=A0ABQ2BZQ1_9FLAO|nr:BamA/TamA family outer membrane protein [Winogradskyella haliclonae]GGI56988.1 membrane protein [Winogradskyella haliclonae]